MKFLTNLRQTLRAPVRTALYALLIALLTAFFCVSLNLWRNSEANLRLADKTYKTIAVMELYADVDSRGNPLTKLRDAEVYAGYLPTAVTGYDLSPIADAPGVVRLDLRARYGVYVPDTLALRPDSVSLYTGPVFFHNIIRFTVDSKSPVVLQNWMNTDVTPIVLEDALGLLEAGYRFKETFSIYLGEYGTYLPDNAGTIRALAGGEDVSEDAVVLLPGVEYIASIQMTPPAKEKDDPYHYWWLSGVGIENDLYGAERWISYSMEGEAFEDAPVPGQPFAIQRCVEVQSDGELGAYFDAVKQAYYISARSFGVIATNDVLGVPAFHLGGTYMREGRVFTQAEYDAGARVCMISADLARAQGWSVGDTIVMNLYEYGCFLNDTRWSSELAPVYTYPDENGFFDAGEYTVVGIFEMRPMTGRSSVSESALSVPWNTIFVPRQSVQNAPPDETQPVSGALLTIWLKNGSIDEFLGEMDALGLTGQKQGGYEARFTFYDQGYSRMQPSLAALSGTAELLLILSSALLLCAAVLLAFFYALNQKQNLGVMRMLGCGKTRAAAAALLGAFLTALVGAGIGAAAGYALTETVGKSILANAASEPAAHMAYSAFLATDQAITIEFALGADARMTLYALLCVLGLFLLFAAAFTGRYLLKKPRALVPQGHE